MTDPKITVIVVDDSALMRQILTEMLNGAPDITVVAQAPDPLVARELIKKHQPNVMTLDVEMPHMDGLSFLERIMTLKPMPVIMVSTETEKGAEITLRALELGAVDFLAKPRTDLQANLAVLTEEIRNKVRAAAAAKVQAYVPRPAVRSNKAAVKLAPAQLAGLQAPERVIAIGASTGGVEALTEVLTHMPPDSPPILVTQHMPEKFTEAFALRLDNLCPLKVAEAVTGAALLPGHVYIAPGGSHLELSRAGANFICKVTKEPPVSGHRPSVDVLFRSVARLAGKNAVGVILTGMGKDGAEGLLAMRQAGARTLGQDAATSVVYGMPKVAFEIGGVEKQYPIKEIAGNLAALFKAPIKR